MKTMAIGELKARFSEVLDEVAGGSPVIVGRGRGKKKIAVLVSYEEYMKAATPRRLGVLEDRAEYRIHEDFKISDEELLVS